MEILSEHDFARLYSGGVGTHSRAHRGLPWSQLLPAFAGYGTAFCKASGQSTPARAFYEPYVMPGRKINPHRGWEIYEQRIYDIAQNIKRKLWQYRMDADGKWNGS